MISGSFSIDSANIGVLDFLSSASYGSDLSFNLVSSGGFTGGYWLNSRLPLNSCDFFWSDKEHDIMVLMSGYLYNRAEFSSYLQPGEQIADPQLVARLFNSEGPDFVKRLNGDFALFVLRPDENRGYLYRDHVGIRPLAYSVKLNTLHFSTDEVGLCRALTEDYNIDSEYLLSYFKLTDYRKTPDRKVYKLMPGHYLEISKDGCRVTRYWDPENFRQNKNLNQAQMLADLKSILQDAVKIRCDRRFTAGAHVSGGLDSGFVAAIARRQFAHQKDFIGFSWSPKEFEMPEGNTADERELVLSTCMHAGIRPVFSEMDSNDFPGIVAKYAENYGFFSEAHTLDQAVKFKTNLIFSGWGGDEFVSTGGCAIEFDLLRSMNLRTFFRRHPIFPFRRFARTMLSCVIHPALGLLDKDVRNTLRRNGRFIRREFRNSDKRTVARFYFITSRRQFHLGMLNCYHLQNRCENWTLSGYRKGIEYRYPLLDRRIIEYMLKVPSKLLWATDYNRPLLRLISDGILPEKVRWNKSKNDPAYWRYIEELFARVSSLFIDETEIWKKNPMLNFINFDLLEKEIANLKPHTNAFKGADLFRGLVYIKAINDFTNSYREGSRYGSNLTTTIN